MSLSGNLNHYASTPVIVTDGLWRKSLSSIRSLGKSGFQVHVLGDSWLTTGFWSRFATTLNLAPSAARDQDGFGEALIRLVQRYPGSVILPMEDPSLLWCSTHRKRIESEGGNLLLPSHESITTAEDKRATLRVASELGLPCPKTWEPASSTELISIIESASLSHFVIKPIQGTGSSGILYDFPIESKGSPDALRRHWDRFGPLLLQERVPAEGRGLGVSLLFDRAGECVASFAHERLKQYPVSGGPSTDRKSIHAPELVQMSIRLLKKMNWRGIGMVEWKENPKAGTPMLMEVNPRFWGSLELAVRAGVDFPTLFTQAALGERFASAHEYPADIRCRWLVPGDILRYLTETKAKRESLPRFLSGLPKQAEEWDTQDLRGFLATWICMAGLALNPFYWKYLLRG